MLAYRLKFKSALHVESKGSGSPDTAQEFVHSDTLSAAICASWPNVFPGTAPDFFADPGFVVSSAMPWIKDILFFPVPRFRIWNETRPADKKDIKKICWISGAVLEHVLRGQMLDSAEVRMKGQFAFSPGEDRVEEVINVGAWKMLERQRVSVDRLGGQSEAGTFFFAQQHFHPECGLYFLAEVAESTRFEAVLEFLGDTGLGADRSSGLGCFHILEIADPGIKLPATASGWFTLSLFNPGQEDDISAVIRQSAYSLLSRSGWITGTGVGRPPIKAFSEGSFFGTRPVGRIVKVVDNDLISRFGLPLSNPVYRDLRAFSVPCVTPSWIKEA